MIFHDTIDRRGAIGLMAGTAALAGAPGPAFAAPVGNTSFDTPSAKLRTLMLMRGALDDRLVIYWLRGRYFGLVEGEIKPLFGVVNACFSRYRPHEDGGYIGVRGEISHYTDFITGAVIREVNNPYTGRMMHPPARGYPPSPVRIQADCSIIINEMPGVQFENVIERVEANADDARIFERSMSKVPMPVGKPSLYNEMLTYRARTSDLERASAKRVPCDINFTNTVSWRSWMGMNDRPGHMLAVGAGSFVSSVKELPRTWLDATAASQPELISNPGIVLDPVWQSLGS